jgi:hypothetical protein
MRDYRERKRFEIRGVTDEHGEKLAQERRVAVADTPMLTDSPREVGEVERACRARSR